jgi:tetratricopeptide (TPR) repeat protein
MRVIALIVMLAAMTLGVRAADDAITPREARRDAKATAGWLATLYERLADQHFHTGNWDDAVSALDRVIILKPVAGVDPYASAAWLLFSTGKMDEAMAMYQRMIEENPTDPDGYFELGMFYFRRHNYSEALAWFEKAVALGLPLPKRHMYGHTLSKLGRNADALAFWEQVLVEEPTNEVAQREVVRLRQPQPAVDVAPYAHDHSAVDDLALPACPDCE